MRSPPSLSFLEDFIRREHQILENFKLAVSNNNSKEVKKLLKKNPYLKQEVFGGPALYNASENGHLEIVKILINAGVDVNLPVENGLTPLHISSHKGHVEVVEALIKAGAKVDSKISDDKTPLHISSHEGHVKVVEALIKAGASPNFARKNGATPLHIASSKGYLEVVEALIKAGADPNLAQKDGITPLHIASQEGYGKIVDVLLNAGAKVDSKISDDGKTPLHLASLRGRVEIVEALIKAGAKVDSKILDDKTPLHIASEEGHVEVVEALIKAGADPNFTRKDGTTPLYLASKNGNLQIVKNLLEKKECISDLLNPAHVAFLNNNFDVLKELFKKIPIEVALVLEKHILEEFSADSEKTYKSFELLFDSLSKQDQIKFLVIKTDEVKGILDYAIENKNYKVASLISKKILEKFCKNDYELEQTRFAILFTSLQNHSSEIEFSEFIKSLIGSDKIRPDLKEKIEQLKVLMLPEQQEKIDKALDEIDKSPPKVLSKAWELFKEDNIKDFTDLILKEGFHHCFSLKYVNENSSDKTFFHRLAEDNSDKSIMFLKRIVNLFRLAKNKDTNVVFDFDLSTDIKHKSEKNNSNPIEQEEIPGRVLRNITTGATAFYSAVIKQNLEAVKLLFEYCDINHVTTSYDKNGRFSEFLPLNVAIAKANSDKPIDEANPKIKIIDHENSMAILKLLTGGDDGKGKKASLFRSEEHRKKIAKKFEYFKDDVKQLLEARYPDEIKLMKDEKEKADKEQKVEESSPAKVGKAGGEDRVERSGFKLQDGTFVSLRSMSLVSERGSSNLVLS